MNDGIVVLEVPTFTIPLIDSVIVTTEPCDDALYVIPPTEIKSIADESFCAIKFSSSPVTKLTTPLAAPKSHLKVPGAFTVSV